MEPILITLHLYAETNRPPALPWPRDAITRRAKAIQRRIEFDLYNARLPSLSLSQDPKYANRGGLLLPIPTWEKAVEIELERIGITPPPAAVVPDGWTTARAYAETYSRNQEPGYLAAVALHASKTDPLPAGPYKTRLPEVWAKSFLKVRP